MNNLLLITMVIMGVAAIYWVLFGQRKYNKMMKNE